MSLPQEWIQCLQVAGAVALGVALIAAVAAGLQRAVRSVLWHRAIWHAAILGLLALVLVEISGVPREAAGWIHFRKHDLAVSPTRSASFQVPQTTATGLLPAAMRLTPEFRTQVSDRLARNRENMDVQSSDPAAGGHASPNSTAPRAAAATVILADPASPESFLEGQSMPWPELIWMIGTVAVLGPICLARCLFLLLHYRRNRIVDGPLLERVNSIARRIGLRRRMRVFESAHFRGPVAFGLLRPSVGLPKDFTTRFSAQQQEVMLAHELAHLAARDPGWQWLSDLMVALLWWHPVAWWIRNRVRSATEIAADEASLIVADGPGVLAECLVQLASHAVRPPALAWLDVTGGGFRSGLGKRIERLVELRGGSWSPIGRAQGWLAKTLAPAVLVAAAVLCTAWVHPKKPSTGNTMKTIVLTWKRSVSTLALFTAFAGNQGVSQVNSDPAAPAGTATSSVATPSKESPAQAASGEAGQTKLATLLQEARLLQEAGKLDEAEAKLKQAATIAPQSKKVARALSLVQQARSEKAAEAAASGESETSDPHVKVVDPARSVSRYSMDPRLAARYGLIPQNVPTRPDQDAPASDALLRELQRKADPNTPATPTAALTPAYQGIPQNQPGAAPRMDPRIAARYGLAIPPATGPATGGLSVTSKAKDEIETKLNEIKLKDVDYDGLPLTEIVRDLNDQALKRDPEKAGINFLITNVSDVPPPMPNIDPATGQPLPVPERVNLGDVQIRLHVRNVRLKDVLDAIVRLTEPPIMYSIEDYGVVFSRGRGQPASFQDPTSDRAVEPARLQVRTFRVDTNSFVAGLEGAFGITIPAGGRFGGSSPAQKAAQIKVRKAQEDLKRAEQLSAAREISEQELNKAKYDVELAETEVESVNKDPGRSASPQAIQQALRTLLNQLGIDTRVPGKAVFYNGLTGVLMVRATAEDLELVQAAIETLAGKAVPQAFQQPFPMP
jgi:beta-lactamase regulating signal transducer with metallopeptidase domain